MFLISVSIRLNSPENNYLYTNRIKMATSISQTFFRHSLFCTPLYNRLPLLNIIKDVSAIKPSMS